ncbi:MAG: tyrosine-protein phosphatase [Sphingomonadales bacterium]|nr:tyrosine-protein phosphatase [Sphingomonadales bacterium]
MPSSPDRTIGRPTIQDQLDARLLPLEGGINFRDMGGYAAAGGRTVKWRHLYRSGAMAQLTAADSAALAARGIRLVVDLRSTREQAEAPTRWVRDHGIAYWVRDHDESFGHLHAMLEKGDITAADARQVMIFGNAHLPRQQAPAFAALMRALAEGEVPVAFNCTAGKDRTGGAAALVLATLGVARADITADYLLTNHAVDLATAFRTPPDPARAARYAGLDPAIGDAIRVVRPEYIAAFLDALDREWGGVENYLAELGLKADAVAEIRANLLD